jgi:hypothetical protein
MSISGVSATSSAAYIQQQLQTATAATATGTTTAQTTGAQAASAQQADPTQQSGQVHHHHHHHHGGGGQAAQSADVNQSGTATAGGTNILDALV